MRALSTRTLIAHRSPVAADALLELVDATAGAGFDAVSVWSTHCDWAVASGMSSNDFFAYHDDRGLEVASVEVLFEWASDVASLEREARPMIAMAAEAQARTVIAVALESPAPPVRTLAEGLAALCDLAADYGLDVSFEFLPFSGVTTLSAAAQLIDAVQRPNLGLVLDVWHWTRQPGGPDFSTLSAFPADRIHMVQLDDTAAEPGPDIIAESTGGRLLPGAGSADIAAMLDALVTAKATPMVAAEVFSRSLPALGPAEMARRVYAAVESVIGDRPL